MKSSLIVLFFFAPAFSSSMKMAKIFGEVESGPVPVYSGLIPMKDCFDKCYNDPDCILAEFDSEQCSLYTFSSTQTPLKVVETEPENLMYVAIKTILPEDTCPVSFEAITLTYIHPNGTAFPWKVDSDGFYFAICQNLYKRFDRPSGISVCIRQIDTLFANRTDSIKFCSLFNATIIGVETQEEVVWMTAKLSDLFYKSFWLDGVMNLIDSPFGILAGVSNFAVRKEYKHFQNFEWTNNLTTGYDALPDGIPIVSNGTLPVCLTMNATASFQYRSCATSMTGGIMCGYRLL
ncbi:hypothetical protein CAEBREN_25514 [Caenorhabditis brenneri]|uniref:PAN-3 domain-containing protein n=1 Tax=Caenorhabditis brenneri TaxID=135651 RepID=G0NSR4_CAEBE|nr:hypothetical protein CAEBREN_25514 [Caenorhabditis brenneri]